MPFDGGQPVAVRGRVVVAAAVTVALDERVGAEVFQARSRRHQGLSAAFSSRVRVLRRTRRVRQLVGERTLEDLYVTRVCGNCSGRGQARWSVYLSVLEIFVFVLVRCGSRSFGFCMDASS